MELNSISATIASVNPWLLAVAVNTVFFGIAALLPKKLLTPAGYLHAWILGVLVWGSLGWQGYAIVMFYFLVGSAVTSVGKAQKEAAGIAEKRSGMRGPENVWGSAFVATLCALGVLGLCWSGTCDGSDAFVSLLLLAYVASFATKLSDTVASEVGKAYGKHTYLVTTFESVSPGTEGAVSWEGTIAGVIASLIMAAVGWSLGLLDAIGLVWCAIAAFIATTIESAIGAIWQDRFEWLTNELVNVINTFVGAIVVVFLAVAWRSLH